MLVLGRQSFVRAIRGSLLPLFLLRSNYRLSVVGV